MNKISALSSAFIFFSLFLFLIAKPASAEVTAFDAATSINTPVMLKALTSGRFFPEGGVAVEYYLEGEKIAATLSGGDGYAFVKLIPSTAGIKIIKVKAGEDVDEGALLVAAKSDRVILVEIESALLESPYTLKPLEGARDALREIRKKYRIIYMTSSIGAKKIKAWLKENSFPVFPVLNWNDAALLSALSEQGIDIDTVIGSAAVLSQSAVIKKKFSFEETEDGTVVGAWKELLKKLSSAMNN